MRSPATNVPEAVPWAARVGIYVYPTATALLIFIVWEAVTRAGWVSPLILPAPSIIIATSFENLPLLLQMSGTTAAEFLLGFALSVAIGLPLGALVVYARPIELAIYPLLVAFQTLPKAAVAPIFIVWLGTGITSKVLIAFAIAFFPIVIDTVVGLRSAQPETIHLVRSMGGSPLQVFWYVRFPNALPAIFAGLKVASTLAVVGAIVGEFVSSDRGLGYLVLVANGELKTPLVFACVLILTILGIIFYFLVEQLEKFVVRWHVSSRQVEAVGTY
ncbi:MAG TPA: ABC transporter permease [Pseudolabrys sp.]|nr:ABC transporter permease [Pseudolabrys sp.]